MVAAQAFAVTLAFVVLAVLLHIVGASLHL